MLEQPWPRTGRVLVLRYLNISPPDSSFRLQPQCWAKAQPDHIPSHLAFPSHGSKDFRCPQDVLSPSFTSQVRSSYVKVT